MRGLKISDSGDLIFNGNELVMTDEASDIQQSVRIILQTRLEEFFFDENLGLERDNMLGKDFNLEFLEQDISLAILEQEDRIGSVDDIRFEQSNRCLCVQILLTRKGESDQLESEVFLNA